jgi:hypothetical protein
MVIKVLIFTNIQLPDDGSICIACSSCRLYCFLLDAIRGLLSYTSASTRQLASCPKIMIRLAMSYLIIETMWLCEIDNVELDCFTFCISPLDVFTIHTKVKPLLMRSTIRIQSHQQIVLIIADFSNEI